MSKTSHHGEGVKWIPLLKRHVNSDVWSLIVVDYYYRHAHPSQDPQKFLRDVISNIYDSKLDPVRFHHALLCAGIQILEGHFDKVFVMSADFLEKSGFDKSYNEIHKIADQYRLYQQYSEFVAFLDTKYGTAIPTGALVGGQPEVEISETAPPNEQPFTTLDERVIAALSRVHTPASRPFDEDRYFQQFKKSGKIKAERFLSLLEQNETFNTNDTAVVSVGGGDGSEITNILDGSKLQFGILLEKNNKACEIARSKAHELEKRGKTLKIIVGDVKETIADATRQLSEWSNSGKIKGVTYTINAILHELPSRKRGGTRFHLAGFVHEIVQNWKPFLIALREPIKGVGWPATIQLRCEWLPPTTLRSLAELVSEKLRISSKLVEVSNNYVEMSTRLAVEVLFKLFYIDMLEHELEESVTAVSSNALKQVLNQELGRPVDVVYENSPTFIRLFEDFRISFRDPINLSDKGKPTVFMSAVGKRL
jgi:hypothetical protein